MKEAHVGGVFVVPPDYWGVGPGHTPSPPPQLRCVELRIAKSLCFFADPARYAFQWDLVCDRKSLVAIAQSCTMVGRFVGSLVCGFLADR